MRAAALVFLQLIGLALSGRIGPVKSGGSTNIVDGEDAKLDEFPFQVTMQIKEDNQHFCGGSVLNENFVLTAAHCCADFRPEDIHIEAGGVNIIADEGVEQKVDVIEIIMHPEYRFLENDICLLKLAKALKLDTVHVKPVTLPEKMQETAPGTLATVSGWGYTRPLRSHDSDILQKVNVPIISDESCSALYEDTPYDIADSMICAGYDQGGKDSCKGDSGGPLVDAESKILIGIVSWGEGCARPQFPGVYTEVSHFVDWINSHIATE